MRHSHRATIASATLVASVLTGGVSFAQDYGYALIRLPVLNSEHPYSWTSGINEGGYLVGASSVDADHYHAVLWTPTGVIQDLGTIGGDFSEAKGINENGEIVGYSSYQPGQSWHEHRAFLWRDNQMTDLGTLGGARSEAYKINDSSQIVGYTDLPDGGAGFIWENGQMSALPDFGQGRGTASDINNTSLIVGWSLPDTGGQRAAFWENRQIFALPTLLGRSSAQGINEAGQMVGQAIADYHDHYHAVAWIDKQITDLHRASLGQNSAAWGINDSGQIVGWVGTAFTNQRGFLWQQSSGMQRLDDLMPPRLTQNWRVYMAWDINDAGQIAAQCCIGNRALTQYPFVITPVHPTMNLDAPVPGRAGQDNTLSLSIVTPGTRVTFLYSLHGGGTRIPGCDLQQNALQLEAPRLIGSAVANSHGVATLTRHVPLIARGQTVLFQAVVQNECAISQLVVHQFD